MRPILAWTPALVCVFVSTLGTLPRPGQANTLVPELSGAQHVRANLGEVPARLSGLWVDESSAKVWVDNGEPNGPEVKWSVELILRAPKNFTVSGAELLGTNPADGSTSFKVRRSVGSLSGETLHLTLIPADGKPQVVPMQLSFTPSRGVAVPQSSCDRLGWRFFAISETKPPLASIGCDGTETELTIQVKDLLAEKATQPKAEKVATQDPPSALPTAILPLTGGKLEVWSPEARRLARWYTHFGVQGLLLLQTGQGGYEFSAEVSWHPVWRFHPRWDLWGHLGVLTLSGNEVKNQALGSGATAFLGTNAIAHLRYRGWTYWAPSLGLGAETWFWSARGGVFPVAVARGARLFPRHLLKFVDEVHASYQALLHPSIGLLHEFRLGIGLQF